MSKVEKKARGLGVVKAKTIQKSQVKRYPVISIRLNEKAMARFDAIGESYGCTSKREILDRILYELYTEKFGKNALFS